MMASVALRTPVALFGNIEAIGFARSRLTHIWSGVRPRTDLLVCRRAEQATSTTRMQMWNRDIGNGILDNVARLDQESLRFLTSTGSVEDRGDRTILNGIAASTKEQSSQPHESSDGEWVMGWSADSVDGEEEQSARVRKRQA